MRPLEPHHDVGAYALGVLGEAEAFRFEDHLMDCPYCAGLLGDFGRMEAHLAWYARSTPPGAEAMASDGGRLLHRVLGLVEARQRTGRRRRFVLLVAAVVLAAGGAFALVRTGAGGAEGGQRWAATDPASGVSAVVAARPAAWGTEVGLDVRDEPRATTCVLVAVGRGGEEQTVATWSASDGKTVRAAGGAALPLERIDHFEVRTAAGERLVSVGPQTP
ncbi:zf-HC2 domain-containing protein [Streptomyces sp. NBC_01465]|uniref:zf-HC2 domain-containing protein n=1 Tax=Streptomyces sp. NBC_01465 TaxID=2903878 RepID=UPI002E313AA5|nr:zf-HC2 domain-containing protein [Streptomyces sp. NBC_01465]